MKLKLRYVAPFLLFAFCILASPLLAQSASPSPGEGARGKTLWEQIKEGGWVMVPIALCSIATLYLIGDGVLRTAPKRVAPPEHEQRVKELFRQGDYVGAYKFCRENPSALTNVLRVGISLL